ncbi:MAG: glycosylase [Anaerolineales bacterium]|nr:glycosylase [Anaerolineales bacterium]
MTPRWLNSAILYQLYPQSFCDSNGDGIGDLAGILAKLDYLQALGVDAVWINPCFLSPFQDAGYDVSDYYRIAPRYGTNEEMRALFSEAHRRGMKILLDLVAGHTSIENPWFGDSCKHERNEYSDWYIWTDSGWTWEAPGLRLINGYAERDASYAVNFFYCQPSLNYGFARPDPKHPWQQGVDAPGPRRVRRELRAIMKFWLDLGCDGFRVDMAASLVKNDPGWRGTIKLWREIRAWLEDDYPQAALISEWSHPPSALRAGFHADFLLHFGSPGYSALFRKQYPGNAAADPSGHSFFEPGGRGNIRAFLDEYEPWLRAARGKGLISLVSGSHDMTPRLSRGRTADDLEWCFLFLMTMPAVPCIYYGDEIGMRTGGNLPSREGGLGRTGVRTPMQWGAGRGAGFSSAPPEKFYLPVDPAPDFPNVAAQEQDPASLLNRIRRMAALRRSHPALQAEGGYRTVYGRKGKYPFVYERSTAGETIWIALNPANRPANLLLPNPFARGEAMIETLYGADGGLSKAPGGLRLALPGVSGGVYQITGSTGKADPRRARRARKK